MAARGAYLALSGLMALAGCDTFTTERLEPPPPVPAPAPEPPQRSADSLALERYYARIETSLASQGLLRTDGGGRDTPWDAEDLTRNFIRIATFEEYDTLGDRIVQRQTESRIHRWETPVRLEMEFGETVSPVKQLKDTDAVKKLVRRPRRRPRATRSRMVESGGKFPCARRQRGRAPRPIGPPLRQLVPDDLPTSAVRNRHHFCRAPATAWCSRRPATGRRDLYPRPSP